MGAEISLKAFSIVSFLQEALDDSELRLVSDVFKLFLIENDGSYFLVAEQLYKHSCVYVCLSVCLFVCLSVCL